jgi:hypothetical protein
MHHLRVPRVVWMGSETQSFMSSGRFKRVDVIRNRFLGRGSKATIDLASVVAKITAASLERNTRVASELFGMRTLRVREHVLLFSGKEAAGGKGLRPDLRPQVRFPASEDSAAGRGPPRRLVRRGQRPTDRVRPRPRAVRPVDAVPGYYAQVCGAPTPDHALSCPGNPNFVDGMHFCPETMGGRIVSGLACLFGCAERHHHDDDDHDPTTSDRSARNDRMLRSCERACNDKFTSLDPIPRSEMVRPNATSDLP